ncbi:TIGR03364 family FAD-dependent oxidoreductase [Leucobacter denitrificans]|uniref:TIGR03364 family FAD-dependent oxidoreductase n=1 Tax=Leucobacter denitrificans TaxID=683042 RepID=A0A7G9S7Y9_9MICO|nr:TIGR03364 family FAD-dependent oxidoreductase [Leucobacter denitrificans]
MSAPKALSVHQYDLVIIGAGIVGLSHAWHALRLGLRIAIVERDDAAVGASVRNFGHIGVSAHSGKAREYAEIARAEWLAIAAATGITVGEVGTTVILRNELEAAVTEEFAATNVVETRHLDSVQAADVLGTDAAHIHSGLHLPYDLKLDPLTAIPTLARHLGDQGVDFYYATNAGRLEPGCVYTSRGKLNTKYIVLAVNHDIDRFFPEIADLHSVERCRLRMLEIEPPRGVRINPGILTGLSLLRYDAFRELPSHDALRAHFAQERPELLEHDLNHMLTQRPDGILIVGDTHHRERTESPFELERSDDLLLRETQQLFGVDHLTIRRRWRGLYASSASTNFVSENPLPGVRAISVTTGIGMTTALGFARASLESLLNASSTPPSDPLRSALLTSKGIS